MKPMATNGGMASQFFPPNFLLQMQQPLPHHHQQEEDNHGHHHHFLPPPHAPYLSPFLQDFGGSMAPLPPLLVDSKRPPPPSTMYPDVDDDQPSNQHQLAAAQVSDDEDGSAAAGCGGEKKRRLGVDQVRTLESNFELANKLEPERKLQLARALGLQPRQVAIWFQNRRARWKTKQLEKDYDSLRRQFDAARAENDALLAHNNKLQAEIMALKGGRSGQEAASELINLNVKETEASCSENSSEINLDVSCCRPAPPPPVAASSESAMHRGAIQFYGASVDGRRPSAGLDIDQLLRSHSSSTAVAQLKVEQQLGSGNADGDVTTAAATNFGSLLCGAVAEPGQFWPWADGHHNFQ